ncbi:MAG: DSD1 family PLP-dependent enzyme [Clostridiales bacterium]|nr:DSD1 family PLP-dependent enzyme [Clostridiales bacterium]
MRVSQIETPALIVDLDVMEQNMARMAEILKPLGAALRPHYKSNKCTAIVKMQLERGAKGITCAKLGEAEDLIRAGVEDVLIANQIIDPHKIARVAYLAKCCRLAVCVDTEENILALSRAAEFAGSNIHCLVEYDIGMRRCGVTTKEEALALAKAVIAAPGLSFMGIQAYAGNLAHEYDDKARTDGSDAVEADLRALKAFFEENGVMIPEISGVSTGTVEKRREGTVYTEVQAGSYIFMDAAYREVGAGFSHSLFMLSSVVSADEDHFVVDAGMKSLGVDQGPPLLLEYQAAEVSMSEEHTTFRTPNSASVGDKLKLIPGHCCTTVNLSDMLYFVRDDKVVDCVPVTSRGKAR